MQRKFHVWSSRKFLEYAPTGILIQGYKEPGVSFFMITFNCLSSYGLEEQIEKEE
jgi:hypothetical protein